MKYLALWLFLSLFFISSASASRDEWNVVCATADRAITKIRHTPNFKQRMEIVHDLRQSIESLEDEKKIIYAGAELRVYLEMLLELPSTAECKIMRSDILFAATSPTRENEPLGVAAEKALEVLSAVCQ